MRDARTFLIGNSDRSSYVNTSFMETPVSARCRWEKASRPEGRLWARGRWLHRGLGEDLHLATTRVARDARSGESQTTRF